MAGETISFEELFEQQNAASTALRFAAQQIPDDSEHVKVTPVDADGKCWCSRSLTGNSGAGGEEARRRAASDP